MNDEPQATEVRGALSKISYWSSAALTLKGESPPF